MKLIKRISFVSMIFMFVTMLNAQEKASPAATAVGIINGAKITINYSSPAVKGRAIWDGLVPFNKVWRAGANEATTIETDKPLLIEGQKLPAGKYSFFIIPNKEECVLIFNNVTKQWGSNSYAEKDDQLRVAVKQKTSTEFSERLNYNILKDKIVINWENWAIPFLVN